MSTRARTVRNVRNRSFGSGTRLVDEVSIPAPLYYGGRALALAFRHRRRTAWLALFVLLAVMLGGMGNALVATGLLAAARLTVWLAWRGRGAEGAAFSLRSMRDARAELARRRALERQWDIACRSASLTGPNGGDPPRLRKVRGQQGSLTATVRSGVVGVPVPRMRAATETLAEVIGCREVVVKQSAPGVASLSFHWTDPIGRLLPLADLPICPDGRLAYGIRQDGSVASIVATQSVLIGGLTRHGKSNLVWALIAYCIRHNVPLDLYISDPKGGVELEAFEQYLVTPQYDPTTKARLPRTRLVEVRGYAKDAAETITMVDAVEKRMHKRQAWMKQNGARKVTPDMVNPLVVVILDETLPLTKILKDGTDSALGRIGYTGAAAAFVVWANTQVAQIDAIGRFRDLIPQRICFATGSPAVTDAVLGTGSESLGAHCSSIDEPGVGYSYDEGAKLPVKFRAAVVTDKETRSIAKSELPANVKRAARDMQAHAAEKQADGKANKNRRTALYRFYYMDALQHPAQDPTRPEVLGARPAYIGIGYDALRRASQHTAGLREFTAGDYTHTVKWYDTRKQAEAAEQAAIREEDPIYNIAHAGNGKRRRPRMPQMPHMPWQDSDDQDKAA